MKKAICVLFLLLTVFAVSLTLTGCGDGSHEGNPNAVGDVTPI